MSCSNQKTESALSNCTAHTEVNTELTKIYKTTLEAILSAQHQILCQCSQVGLPGTTCRVPSTCPIGFQGRYTVRPGDTMFLIAQRCGVSLQALINANPHISDPSQIFPCDVLCVPPRCSNQVGQPGTFCRIPSTCPPDFQGRYTVKPGDTIFLIAERCGVTLQALIDANPHISDPSQIFPCDVLCVPQQCADGLEVPEATCRVPSTCPAGFQGRYTVRPGDTMFLIAQRCGVSLQALVDANPHISDPSQIFPCDVLCVPLQCANLTE